MPCSFCRRRNANKFIEEEEEPAQGQVAAAQVEEEEDELAEDENDPRVHAKRAKIGHLWDLLNKSKPPPGQAPSKPSHPAPELAKAPAEGAGKQASAAPKALTGSTSLAALCRPAAKPTKAAARNSDEVQYMVTFIVYVLIQFEPAFKPKASLFAVIATYL
jgi:hypothetical protein